MLDLYKRDCPRCGAKIDRQPVLCKTCHKLLPAKLSKSRRVLEGALLTALSLGAFSIYFTQELLPRLLPAPVAAVKIEPWRGPGPEPAARAWAVRIEGSLESVCSSTYLRFVDRKAVVASLGIFLGQVTRRQGQPLTADALRFTPGEEQEALALLNDEVGFRGRCLARTYAAIASCARFQGDLGSAQAAACMTVPVMRTLASAPYRWCAEEAKLPRVRLVCETAAGYADRNLPKG